MKQLTDDEIHELATNAGIGFFGKWMAYQCNRAELVAFARAILAAALPPAAVQTWQLIDQQGRVVATERSCIKAWARINGYKPTVENLLGYEEKGWRVSPLAAAVVPTWDQVHELAVPYSTRDGYGRSFRFGHLYEFAKDLLKTYGAPLAANEGTLTAGKQGGGGVEEGDRG